jgi:hypothetical protein
MEVINRIIHAITETQSTENLVSFSNDVLPIIESRCLNCHGGERREEGLNMTSYAGLLAGSVNGATIRGLGDPGSAKQLFEEFRETNNPWFNFNHHGFLFLNWFPPNLQDQLKLAS